MTKQQLVYSAVEQLNMAEVAIGKAQDALRQVLDGLEDSEVLDTLTLMTLMGTVHSAVRSIERDAHDIWYGSTLRDE